MSPYEYRELLKFLYFEEYADSYEEAENLLESMSDEKFQEVLDLFNKKEREMQEAWYTGSSGYRRTASGRRVMRDEPDEAEQYRQSDEISRHPKVQAADRAASRARLKAKGKVPTKNGKPVFESIVEYLFVEGYADTIEGAELMAENISENWINEIIEETTADRDKKYDAARKRAAQRAAARNAARSSGQTGNVPGVGYVTPRRERETYTDSSGKERHHTGGKMP